MAPALLEAPARPRQVDPPLHEAQDHLLSAEEFELLASRLGPCELIDGVIHDLPMNNVLHSALTAKISRMLANGIEAAGITGRILDGEVGIHTSIRPARTRAADVAYISLERLPELPARGFLRVMPELLVEIISESNTWSDTIEKIYEYFEGGAKAVWIVDPVLREVRAFTSPKDLLVYRAALDDVLDGGDVLPGFSVPVTALLSV